MVLRGIRHDLLDLLMSIGSDRHPYEFVGVLREKNGVINELDLLPGTVSGENSASLFFDMMPLDTHVAGSVHSHPNGVLIPSDADLAFFPRIGRIHVIVGYPYNGDSWRCYRADGRAETIEVIG